MPIMGGTTEDEFTFPASIREYFSGPPQVALTPDQYVAENSAAVVAEYPLSDYMEGVPPGNPTWAQERVTTDSFLCRALHVLKAQAAMNAGNPVYGYVFSYQNAPYYFPQMPNAYNADNNFHFKARASHTIDIQFLFDEWHGGQLGVNLDQTSGQPRELNASETQLSDQLVAAWTYFAANGDPNGLGAPSWPVLTAGSAVFLNQGIPNSNLTEAQYRANYKCDFWDPLLTYPTT